MKRVSLVVTLAIAAGLSAQAASAQTLKTVKDRGMLSCDVSQGLPGFSSPDDKGNWTGLDVDIGRAVAAAIFNDATKVKFVPLSAKDRFTALQSGEIDVLSRNTTWTLSRDTSVVSQLYAERLKLSNPADHAVLPEVISKEPLGPMVRHGDDQWFDIAKWVLFAMIDAEELGVTQKNVDDMAKSDKPELKRAFGTDGNLGEQLGLTKDWMSRIVKAVGNYGESFDRNVGAGSKLGIARGLNNLWNKGGIQYAPPIR